MSSWINLYEGNWSQTSPAKGRSTVRVGTQVGKRWQTVSGAAEPVEAGQDVSWQRENRQQGREAGLWEGRQAWVRQNKNTDLWSDLEEGVGWVKTPWCDYCGGRKNTDASWSPYPYAKGQLGVQQWPPILEAGQRLCESIPQLRGWSPKRNDAKKFPDSGQQSPFSFGSSFRKKHCQRSRLLWALNRPTFGLSLQITFYGPHHLSCPCGQK